MNRYNGLESKIRLSLIFETYDLFRGNELNTIQSDLRDYSQRKGFNIKSYSENSPIFYTDILSVINQNTQYLSDFDWGEKKIALSDMVRLKTTFKTNDMSQWKKETFQNIFNEMIDYVMDKGIYIKAVDENPKNPQVIFSLSDFDIVVKEKGRTIEYHTIEVDLASKIIKYMKEKRKKYNEPGPRNKCETCLANCYDTKRQTFNNMIRQFYQQK